MNGRLSFFLVRGLFLCFIVGVAVQVTFLNRVFARSGVATPNPNSNPYPYPQDRATPLPVQNGVPSRPYPAPQEPITTQQSGSYPRPTSIPLPLPTNSPAAISVTEYFAKKLGVPASSIVIVTDHPVKYQNIGRQYQVVTVLDNRPEGKFYDVLVDLSTKEIIENVASVWKYEDQARISKYGKLQPGLYDRLQTMKAGEKVMVIIWIVTPPGKTIDVKEAAATTLLASKYPEVQTAIQRGGKPMDVDDPKLAEQIYKEYIKLIELDTEQYKQPLTKALEAMKTQVQTSQGLPAVSALLTKDDILALMTRGDVATIYLAEQGYRRTLLSSAVPSDRVPQIWALGYDGTGVNVAILEDGDVDFTSNSTDCPYETNNCFLHPGPFYPSWSGDLLHATFVASVVASNHPVQRGVSYGATIISAGIAGEERQYDIDALVWAINQGADVINASYAWCLSDNQMDPIDRAFDYYARASSKSIIVASGNNDALCPYDYVDAPARAWNVLSVGAYDDSNDPDWQNDSMAEFSAWANPASANGDHEKPEVVAPGVSITGIRDDGFLIGLSGTSFSAPQVAGLAALLMDRNYGLRAWPEAIRAIIMASATHNIAGPTGIPSGQDLSDGAGGINAVLADVIARSRTWATYDPCTSSCWWGIPITNSSFPVGTYIYRYFTANKGDSVRIVIAWSSNADCPGIDNCSYDHLATNLNLGVQDSNGQLVNGTWTASWDNNYELAEFVAPETDTYRIAVYKQRGDEDGNNLAIALLKLSNVFLPLTMK